MQKDFHFYITYALATIAELSEYEAATIAWANQFTDELTAPKLYSLHTQSALTKDWFDKQVQFSVIVPFHFVPGDDIDHPWAVTRNNGKVKSLVKQAKNPFEFGIALHALQDSYSHEGFSGWQEKFNSCFEWYKLKSVIPNVGHAEMGVTPDVTNYTWTDPRSGKIIDNVERAMEAARATMKVFLTESDGTIAVLESIFRQKNYDRRKQLLRELVGKSTIRFKDVDEELRPRHEHDFIEAATKHLARVLVMFEGLPRRDDE